MIETEEIKIERYGAAPLKVIIEVRTGDKATHSWMTAQSGVWREIVRSAVKGVRNYIEEIK